MKNKSLLSLLSLLAVVSLISSCGRKRQNSAIEPIVKSTVTSNDVKSLNYEPIRIVANWDLFSIGKDTNTKFANAIKEKIIPKTLDMFRKMVNVRPLKRVIVDRSIPKCDKYNVPQSLYNGINDADLILLPILDHSGELSRAEGEAAGLYCIHSSLDNRPIVGLIEYNPGLKAESEVDILYHVWLTFHELTHVLVFNDFLFPYYVNPVNNQVLGLDKIVKEVDVKGIKTKYLITPKVREVTQKYFNCPNAIGAPLENRGDIESQGGHWSRKAFNSEYMIARTYGENLISDFTLALFEDSGWYKSNYEVANPYFWGKNSGCGLVELGPCYEKNTVNLEKNIFDVSTKYKNEFCTNFNAPVCSPHYMFRGICEVAESSLSDLDLPFSVNTFHGTDMFTGYCPIATEEGKLTDYYIGSCLYGKKNELYHFEKIGLDSACVIAELENKVSPNSNSNNGNKSNSVNNTNAKLRRKSLRKLRMKELFAEANKKVYFPQYSNTISTCLTYKCTSQAFYVIINNEQFDCTNQGKVKVNKYGIKEIECPNREIVCAATIEKNEKAAAGSIASPPIVRSQNTNQKQKPVQTKANTNTNAAPVAQVVSNTNLTPNIPKAGISIKNNENEIFGGKNRSNRYLFQLKKRR